MKKIKEEKREKSSSNYRSESQWKAFEEGKKLHYCGKCRYFTPYKHLVKRHREKCMEYKISKLNISKESILNIGRALSSRS